MWKANTIEHTCKPNLFAVGRFGSSRAFILHSYFQKNIPTGEHPAAPGISKRLTLRRLRHYDSPRILVLEGSEPKANTQLPSAESAQAAAVEHSFWVLTAALHDSEVRRGYC